MRLASLIPSDSDQLVFFDVMIPLLEAIRTSNIATILKVIVKEISCSNYNFSIFFVIGFLKTIGVLYY